MSFYLSKKSLAKLEGVKKPLVEVVKRAIEITPVDFSISCGLRTPQQQKTLMYEGKTKTLNSKHLTGEAIDVTALINGKASWDITLYCIIADAFRMAAWELKTKIRWGGAWNVQDIASYNGSMDSAMDAYIEYCKGVKKIKERDIFIDGPHFELC